MPTINNGWKAIGSQYYYMTTAPVWDNVYDTYNYYLMPIGLSNICTGTETLVSYYVSDDRWVETRTVYPYAGICG